LDTCQKFAVLAEKRVSRTRERRKSNFVAGVGLSIKEFELVVEDPLSFFPELGIFGSKKGD
jgi:hypothetical protein